MRIPTTFVLLAAVAALLGGCSSPQPSYSTVRDEALDALATIVNMMPADSVVTPRPEQDPYSCKDPLMGNGADGAFHTAYWEVRVPPTMDIPAFIEGLPSRLGDGWRAEDLGVASQDAQVYLVHDDPTLSITVEQSRSESLAGIDLIAVSRCGISAPGEEPRTLPLGR